MIVTVVAAIRDYRKSDDPPAQHNTVPASSPGAVAIGNNVTGAAIITGSVGGDVVLGERPTQGVGQRTAQGWIDKVIKPMLWRLEQVESLLARNDVLTWQHQTGDFARIPTARNLVQAEAKYSLENFVEHYPEVQEMMSLYDQQRANLKAACQCLQKAIMGKKQFYDLYEKAKADNSQIAGQAISRDFEGYKKTELLESLAESIVNRRHKESLDYTFRRPWSQYHDEFLALRSLPDINPESERLDHTGDELLEKVRDLIKLLVAIGKDLVKKHDVHF